MELENIINQLLVDQINVELSKPESARKNQRSTKSLQNKKSATLRKLKVGE